MILPSLSPALAFLSFSVIRFSSVSRSARISSVLMISMSLFGSIEPLT